MHSAVLDATGYALLLSSFIALVILLWKGCKRKKKSPFYFLSASDVVSSALTAIILLANHIETGIRLSYNWQNNTSSDTPNHTWTVEDNYRGPFLQTDDLREAFNEVDRNVTLTCGMKDIFMQYGMLLAAPTNAFISLLTFIVQCNLDAARIKKRCANAVKSLRDTQLGPKDAQIKRRESEREPASLQRDDINAKTSRSNIIRGIRDSLKFRTLRTKEGDKKPTSFLVASHWLVPFLVVGILYFAEYSDMNDVRHIEDIECVFVSNFPMNDFDTFSSALTDDDPNIIDSVAYITEHNYFLNLNKKLSNESKSNSVEIDRVVSKVQNIVRTMLSYRRNSTKDIGTTNILNASEPLNLTEYISANNITRYIKNITYINSVVEGLNDTLMEQDINVHDSSTNDNIYSNQTIEPLFHQALKNLSGVSRGSAENEDNSYREDPQTHFASTEQSATQMTANNAFVRNATFVSTNRIYGEITKRIQAAGVHSAAKNQYNRSVSRPKDGEQPKRKPNSIEDPFSDKRDNRYVNTETRQSGSPHTTNECLISTKFLKLQLFVSSFAVYFLPILLSCILQMRGKHTCKNTLAILRIPSTDSKEIHRRDSAEGSGTPQGLRNDDSGTDTDATKPIKKDRESCRENESIALETERMIRTFNVIESSLILCVVLWTPVFLETLLRVYSCTRVPQWLIDTTFLSAFSFGIVRNALNINIIKIQEARSDAGAKENKIHPVE